MIKFPGFYYVTFIIAFLLTGNTMAQEIDYIKYGRDSGAVPPQYYSRLELEVEPGKISVKRWEGGEVTIDKSFALTPEDFQQILDALPGFKIRNIIHQPDERGELPVGGSNEWLIIKAGAELLNKGADGLEGDVRGLVQLLESFVPEEGKSSSPLMQ
jgi:hypothetical protein